MDKTFIINEIKSYLNIKTDSEFADFLGVKQPTISTWRKRNTIDYDLIISKCNNINGHWLLTGKGSMLKEPEKSVIQNLNGDDNIMIGGANSGQISKNSTNNHIIKELQEENKRLKNLLVEKEKQLTEKEKQISKLIDKLTK